MWSPRKILVPTDFSRNAEIAAQYASHIGRLFDSEIRHFHVVTLFGHDPNHPEHQFPEMENVYASMERMANENLDQAKKEQAYSNVYNEMVRGLSPAEEIIDYAGENQVDLIIMGTHGRSGLRHFLLGSVAEKVIRHVEQPVVTVRCPGPRWDGDFRLERIVVPIDFSTYSKQILPFAVGLAKRTGASLEILHIIEERIHPAYYVTGETSLFKLIPDLREKSISALKEFVADQIPAGVDYSLHIREGRSHTEILEFAEGQSADLIAIATHGLSGLEHLLLGSTAEKVIRKSHIPVMTIRARSKA